MAIYLRDPDTSSLRNLINNSYEDGEDGIWGKFALTYSDKECKTLQCKKANRSFSDLLDIAQTYFPGTTEKELWETMKSLNNDEDLLDCVFCYDVWKIVFYKACHYVDDFPEEDYKDEYYDEDERFTPPIDGWTFEQLAAL